MSNPSPKFKLKASDNGTGMSQTSRTYWDRNVPNSVTSSNDKPPDFLTIIKKNVADEPENEKYLNELVSNYDSLNISTQIVVGRQAYREAEENKHPAVVCLNSLNKSLDTVKEYKKENAYLKCEIEEYKDKYGEHDPTSIKRLQQKKKNLQSTTSSSNIPEILQLLQQSTKEMKQSTSKISNK